MRPSAPEGSLDHADVLECLTQYSPHLPHAIWHLVRPLFLTVLAAFEYESAGVLRLERQLLSRYLAWCVRRDLPMEAERVLHPEPVGQFLHEVIAGGASEKTAAGYRSIFRRWGRRITRDAPWPPEPKREVHDDQDDFNFQPHTVTEMMLHWRLALSQSTPARSRTAITITGLPYGAGLDGTDTLWAQAQDIRTRRRRPFVVVGGTHPREVPIRQPFADELLALARSLDREDFLHGKKPLSYSTSSNLSYSLLGPTVDEVPVIHVWRLRQTWVRDLFADGVLLADIHRAAGDLNPRLVKAVERSLAPSRDARYFASLSRTAPAWR